MRIPVETIDLIRERSRIEEVAQRYIPSLAKKGRNYIGLCPFHKEKTPSFVVSPEKQIFTCFGCHTGGNVFSFIRKMENVDFPESVKIAGEIAGIPVRLEDEGSSEISLIVDVNRKATALYHQYLFSPNGSGALAYLKGRGVSADSIKEFQIGLAPDSWNFISDKLRGNASSFDAALRSGLIAKSQKDDRNYYDRFRRRVMFPINDTSGKTVAFGGRVLDDSLPKYINSQESVVFKKKNLLYGFDKAKAHISDLKRAIIVEGYLDVIGCHQCGIKNVAAPLGTALTGEHVKFLARYCSEIVLLFDADSAGLNAATKSINIADDINVDIKVATLPESDPFEFVLKKGQRALMAVIEDAKSPLDFNLRRIMDVRAKNGDLRTLLACFELLRRIQLESIRSVYLKKIGAELGIDENSIRKDFGDYVKKNNVVKMQRNAGAGAQDDFLTKCHASLVSFLCRHPEFIKNAAMDFPLSDISDMAYKNILTEMNNIYFTDGVLTINKLFDFFDSGSEWSILSHNLEQDSDTEEPDMEYTEIYLSMKIHEINDKILKYVSFINDFPEYLTEIDVLRREKEKLSYYLTYKRN
ncbi:MAG: DNA primase [Leptospirales bacterium]|nr:DNA primase [Leptospirales bacterium]